MKEYVDCKFEYLVNLIKANHIEVMNFKNREDDQQPKDMGGKSTPHMVEVSDEEGNDGHQATSPIQLEFDVDSQTEDTLKNHQVMKDVSELQSPNSNSHHTDETCEHSKDAPSAQTPHHLFEGTMNEDTSDSTPSGSISPDTRETMNTLIADLGSLLIHANQQKLTENQSLLSDSQLPIDISITNIVVRSEINTPHARIRMPSRNCKSPYLTSFGSTEKGKAVMTDVIRPNFPFQGCEITNQAPSYLIDKFIEWVTTGLLKAHSKKKPSEDKYKSRASSLGFEMMDYVVAFPTNKNWFYAMSQPKNCWTDQHIDVIFYYIRKKSKL
ncbi:uncharacterized protein LOC107032326 [Solanum pennellii]|uniref:Uncharacterized protein LOC107032326 n=1 Tax=Solanum pennellii TaxID=28526 RepID=A0ABM1HRT9_SOLPN|nr:uncharacterized protein LOC107032326 [Solanum pennellii]